MSWNKNKLKWASSQAKKLLQEDLLRGNIPLYSHGVDGMDPKTVFGQRPEFAEFPYEQFRGRLLALRKQIRDKKERARSDCIAVVHDQLLNPKSTHNQVGMPRWSGSEADRLLRQDLDEGKHTLMSPMMLYESREEYFENYSLNIFRSHLNQECRRRRKIALFATNQT
jgi:hypothetical protein